MTRFSYRNLPRLIAIATVCGVSTYWQTKIMRLIQRQAGDVKRLECQLDKAAEMNAVPPAHMEEMRAER